LYFCYTLGMQTIVVNLLGLLAVGFIVWWFWLAQRGK
jgi:hypothetical protein